MMRVWCFCMSLFGLLFCKCLLGWPVENQSHKHRASAKKKERWGSIWKNLVLTKKNSMRSLIYMLQGVFRTDQQLITSNSQNTKFKSICEVCRKKTMSDKPLERHAELSVLLKWKKCARHVTSNILKAVNEFEPAAQTKSQNAFIYSFLPLETNFLNIFLPKLIWSILCFSIFFTNRYQNAFKQLCSQKNLFSVFSSDVKIWGLTELRKAPKTHYLTKNLQLFYADRRSHHHTQYAEETMNISFNPLATFSPETTTTFHTHSTHLLVTFYTYSN